jgi:pimeloyl-ACP methyl ester carboxylesterase
MDRIDLAGHVEREVVVWPSLVGNRCGDPPERPVVVYLPECYGREPARRFPTAYVLHGFGERVDTWLEPASVYGGYLPCVDRLMSTGAMPPAVVVFIDGWTRFGGSQYVDSPGTGLYQTYVLQDIVSWVDGHFATLRSSAARIIQGHSSGGLGALLAAFVRPTLFAGVAASAPDVSYWQMYQPIFNEAVRALKESGITFEQWQVGAIKTAGEDQLRTCLALAACFSPSEEGEPQLPFDPATAGIIPDIWARWLSFDPVEVVKLGARLPPEIVVRLSVGVDDECVPADGVFSLWAALLFAGVKVELTTELTSHAGIVESMPDELAHTATALGWTTP